MKDTLKVFQSVKAGMDEVKKIESGEIKGQTIDELIKELEQSQYVYGKNH